MEPKLVVMLGALDQSESVEVERLADKLMVSRRTLRSYVSQANDRLADCARIEMQRGKGYRLIIEDQDAFHALVSRESEEGDQVPSTPLDRVEYLVNDLLNRSDWVTVEALSSALYVSRFTISDDLKSVENLLNHFDLSLERRSHRGIRVAGSEMNRRICLANMAVGKLAKPTRGTWQKMNDAVERVARCVDSVCDEFELHINPAAYQNLLVHIAIAVFRLADDHAVPMDESSLKSIKDSAAYGAAERIAQMVGGEFSIDFPEEEIAYIAIHLAGKQTIYQGTDEKSEGNQVIPEEVWQIVGHMLERVREEFCFDFRTDLELRMNLAKHVTPLAVRLTYRMQMANPLLADIKTRFSLAYAMASEASTVLRDAYGELSEDEIGYIALSFALALDRQQSGASARKNILVVCASGAGSAHLLEHRFREAFGSSLGTILTCDAQSVRSVDFSHIDCVFTTISLGATLPVPVFQVSAFLDDSDIPAVRRALRGLDSKSGLDRFFDSELFFPHMRLQTKADVLEFLCNEMLDKRDAEPCLLDQVLKREEQGYTSFGNNVAMPHPLGRLVDRHTVAVLLLDEPIDWDGKPVQAVFMLCLSKDKEDSVKALHRALSRIMGSESDIHTLISQQRFETLLELLHNHANE